MILESETPKGQGVLKDKLSAIKSQLIQVMNKLRHILDEYISAKRMNKNRQTIRAGVNFKKGYFKIKIISTNCI